MANISKFSFEGSGYRYETSLEWNDKAFMDGSISFNVTASRELLNDPESREDISVSVSIEQDDHERAVLVLRHGEEILGAPIAIEDIFDETSIIDMIPGFVFGGGDPIAGCLIKSGISTSVAQIINCKNLTSDFNWFFERTRAMGKCLLSRIPHMTAKMAYRSTRCILTAGIF